MGLRSCSIAACVMVWASVAVIPFGTHLQTQSPRFPEYERQYMADIIAARPGEDHGPNFDFLAFSWPVVGYFCAFVGLAFTIGLSASLGLQRCNRVIGVIAAVVFGLGCVAGVRLGLAEAAESFRWGFGVLGAGYLIAAVGLGLGALCMVGSCRTTRCNGIAATSSRVGGPSAVSH